MILANNMPQANPESSAFMRVNCEKAKRILESTPASASHSEICNAWHNFFWHLESYPHLHTKIGFYIDKHYNERVPIEETKAALDELVRREEEFEKIAAKFHGGEIDFEEFVRQATPIISQ